METAIQSTLSYFFLYHYSFIFPEHRLRSSSSTLCLLLNIFSLLSQAVCSRRAGWQLMPEVDGVFRSTHQQVEHVCTHVQEERRRWRGNIQQLPLRCGRPRCSCFQPLFQTLRLCREVSSSDQSCISIAPVGAW